MNKYGAFAPPDEEPPAEEGPGSPSWWTWAKRLGSTTLPGLMLNSGRDEPVERFSMLPLGTYKDGSLTLANPSMFQVPWDAAKRLSNPAESYGLTDDPTIEQRVLAERQAANDVGEVVLGAPLVSGAFPMAASVTEQAPRLLGDAVPPRQYEPGAFSTYANDRQASIPALLQELPESANPKVRAAQKRAADVPFADKLVVQHNMTGEKFAHNMRNYDGSIPVPSLAVSKAGHPLTNFGDISLFGPPDLAIPSGRNPVYPADAYTKRRPSLKRDVPSRKDADRLYEKLTGERNAGYKLNLDDPYWDDGFRIGFLRSQGKEPPAGMRPDDWARNALSYKDRPAFTAYVNDWLANHQGVIRERIDNGWSRDGERRLYLPHNLENMVKASKGKAGSEDFDYGPNAWRAHDLSPFGSLSEIQASRGKIGRVDQNDMDAQKNALMAQGYELAQALGYRDTDPGMVREGLYHNDPAIRQMARELRQGLSNLPTEYFEAKPQRAVNLDEFKLAAVPDSMPDIAEQLRGVRGMDVRTYDRNAMDSNGGALTEILRSRPDILFSNSKQASLPGLLNAIEREGGAFAKPDSALAKRQLDGGFYSVLEETIGGAQQKAGTPQQWRNIAQKGGVTKDEMKWRGLDEWLANQPQNEKIPREAIQEVLQRNKVRVAESIHEGDYEVDFDRLRERAYETYEPDDYYRVSRSDEGQWEIRGDYGNGEVIDTYDTRRSAEAALSDLDVEMARDYVDNLSDDELLEYYGPGSNTPIGQRTRDYLSDLPGSTSDTEGYRERVSLIKGAKTGEGGYQIAGGLHPDEYYRTKDALPAGWTLEQDYENALPSKDVKNIRVLVEAQSPHGQALSAQGKLKPKPTREQVDAALAASKEANSFTIEDVWDRLPGGELMQRLFLIDEALPLSERSAAIEASRTADMFLSELRKGERDLRVARERLDRDTLMLEQAQKLMAEVEAWAAGTGPDPFKGGSHEIPGMTKFTPEDRIEEAKWAVERAGQDVLQGQRRVQDIQERIDNGLRPHADAALAERKRLVDEGRIKPILTEEEILAGGPGARERNEELKRAFDQRRNESVRANDEYARLNREFNRTQYADVPFLGDSSGMPLLLKQALYRAAQDNMDAVAASGKKRVGERWRWNGAEKLYESTIPDTLRKLAQMHAPKGQKVQLEEFYPGDADVTRRLSWDEEKYLEGRELDSEGTQLSLGLDDMGQRGRNPRHGTLVDAGHARPFGGITARESPFDGGRLEYVPTDVSGAPSWPSYEPGFRNRENAERALAKLNEQVAEINAPAQLDEIVAEWVDQHGEAFIGVRLTPEMRASILARGFPLFVNNPAAAVPALLQTIRDMQADGSLPSPETQEPPLRGYLPQFDPTYTAKSPEDIWKSYTELRLTQGNLQ